MTPEQEARQIAGPCEERGCYAPGYGGQCRSCQTREAIATALRKRDELYEAAWAECKKWPLRNAGSQKQ